MTSFERRSFISPHYLNQIARILANDCLLIWLGDAERAASVPLLWLLIGQWVIMSKVKISAIQESFILMAKCCYVQSTERPIDATSPHWRYQKVTVGRSVRAEEEESIRVITKKSCETRLRKQSTRCSKKVMRTGTYDWNGTALWALSLRANVHEVIFVLWSSARWLGNIVSPLPGNE